MQPFSISSLHALNPCVPDTVPLPLVLRCKRTNVHEKVTTQKVKLRWSESRAWKTTQNKVLFSTCLSCDFRFPRDAFVLLKTLVFWVKTTAEVFGSTEFSYFYSLSVSASLYAAAFLSPEVITLSLSKSEITLIFASYLFINHLSMIQVEKIKVARHKHTKKTTSLQDEVVILFLAALESLTIW